MVWHNKVVWQEGMFLRAQHFQQQDRHAAHQLQARTAPLRAHPWGLTELAIDRDLLAAGRFAMSTASGVMEDGTPFSIPAGADAVGCGQNLVVPRAAVVIENDGLVEVGEVLHRPEVVSGRG